MNAALKRIAWDARAEADLSSALHDVPSFRRQEADGEALLFAVMVGGERTGSVLLAWHGDELEVIAIGGKARGAGLLHRQTIPAIDALASHLQCKTIRTQAWEPVRARAIRMAGFQLVEAIYERAV